jgi:hypothetical protein
VLAKVDAIEEQVTALEEAVGQLDKVGPSAAIIENEAERIAAIITTLDRVRGGFQEYASQADLGEREVNRIQEKFPDLAS